MNKKRFQCSYYKRDKTQKDINKFQKGAILKCQTTKKIRTRTTRTTATKTKTKTRTITTKTIITNNVIKIKKRPIRSFFNLHIYFSTYTLLPYVQNK